MAVASTQLPVLRTASLLSPFLLGRILRRMILCMSSSSHPFSSSVAPAARVVSFEEARRLVEQHAAGVCPGEMETVDLLAGLGRGLAEGVGADRHFPPFDRATRDGYAVRAVDLAEIPARLEVVGEAKAGCWPDPGVCSSGAGRRWRS